MLNGEIPKQQLPFKNLAGALLFSVFLGPVGLLYASAFGGIVMILLALITIVLRLPLPILFVWVGCCVWSVLAVNYFNQQLLKK